MKKNACIIILLFIVCIGVLTNPAFAKNQIKFIYIHGTNDNNIKKQNEFIDDVNNLHPYIVEEFNKSEIAKKYLLENDKYTISETPIAFYWGAESKKDLNLLSDWLDITKFFSPKLAQTVRSMLAHTLHDAIWIQKYNNMKPILDRLHSLALEAQNNGDKYILLGHSAGSFITYEYSIYKVPFINLHELCKYSKIDTKILNEIKKIGFKNTCIDALVDSDIVNYKRDNTIEIKKDNLIQKFKNLKNVEKNSCASVDNLAGIINFGSPVTLFYSGFSSNDDTYTKLMIESVLNNNIFYLNLNFAEDPLGFPIMSNEDSKKMSELRNSSESPSDIYNKDKHGFVYDKSDIRSNKSVIKAHTYYWKKRKIFSKSIVKAYEEGIYTFVVQPAQ